MRFTSSSQEWTSYFAKNRTEDFSNTVPSQAKAHTSVEGEAATHWQGPVVFARCQEMKMPRTRAESISSWAVTWISWRFAGDAVRRSLQRILGVHAAPLGL